MKTWAAFLAVPLAAASAGAAFADPEQAFDNLQPSLALTEVTLRNGAFPVGSSPSARGATLGFIYDFAGDFVPGSGFSAAGQSLSSSTNPALFSVFGTTFGGSGFAAFNLPNLEGRATVGAGPGLPLGSSVGSATVTLTPAQVPAPGQYLAAQPYDTVQPSLALTPLIVVNGAFPNLSGSSGTSAFLGQIAYYAGSVTLTGAGNVPGGWLPAEGQLLPIASNSALFSVIGTTYGGDGVTTFALPNLVGRVAIGADADNPLGSQKGADAVTIDRAELPGPGEKPLSNDQPSLAVNYLIAISGLSPSPSFDSFDPTQETLGEVVAFAGTNVPAGWALANGQLLPIDDNEALFSVLGTTYGGDGATDFALPDLDGRTVIGASVPTATALARTAFLSESDGAYPVGEILGEDDVFLTSDEAPSAAVPEPATWAMLALGFAAMGFAFRRRRATPALG